VIVTAHRPGVRHPQLWEDLHGLFRRIKDDFDPTLAEVQQRWEAAAAVAA
jgi:hypothetical protein